MISEAIYSILNSSSSLNSYVNGRISSFVMNQESVFPYVVFMLIRQEGNGTKDNSSEVDEINLTVFCLSKDSVEVRNIANSVKSALDGYNGTISGVTIQSCDWERFRDGWEGVSNSYQISVEFILFVKS